MPLVYGYSQASISANIGELLSSYKRSGHIGSSRPRSFAAARTQAVAASLNTARRAWRSRHRRGPFPYHLRAQSNPAWRKEARRVYGAGGAPKVIGSLPARRNPSLICAHCGAALSESAAPGAYDCRCGVETTVK